MMIAPRRVLTVDNGWSPSRRQAAFTAMAVQRGCVPPTLNFGAAHPDEAHWAWDHVHSQPRHCDVRVALSNSFAFGGANASLLFARMADGAEGEGR
jgi:3-oxoacyl-(acyl-carrier-protein) synthase